MIRKSKRWKGIFPTFIRIFVLLVWTGRGQGDFTQEMICSFTMYPTAGYLNWDCPEQRDLFIENSLYHMPNMLTTRFVSFQDVTFFIFPRYRCGVAATLMFARMDSYCRYDPELTPFPSWEMNNVTGENSIVNVVDLFLDDLNVLWVLDIGVLNSQTEPEVLKGPAILSFCPKSRRILTRVCLYQFISAESRLQNMQVEVLENGMTYLYVSDAGTRSILVWDVNKQSGFKVCLPPDVTEYPLCQDVLYISLIKNEFGNAIYFTYLMGKKMFYIYTKLIREGQMDGAISTVGLKPGPMTILGTDGMRTIFFRMRGDKDVFLWSVDQPFCPRNFIVAYRGGTDPRLATHVGLGYKGFIWLLSSNFFDFMCMREGSLGAIPKLTPLVRFCDK